MAEGLGVINLVSLSITMLWVTPGGARAPHTADEGERTSGGVLDLFPRVETRSLPDPGTLQAYSCEQD